MDGSRRLDVITMQHIIGVVMASSTQPRDMHGTIQAVGELHKEEEREYVSSV